MLIYDEFAVIMRRGEVFGVELRELAQATADQMKADAKPRTEEYTAVPCLVIVGDVPAAVADAVIAALKERLLAR